MLNRKFNVVDTFNRAFELIKQNIETKRSKIDNCEKVKNGYEAIISDHGIPVVSLENPIS